MLNVWHSSNASSLSAVQLCIKERKALGGGIFPHTGLFFKQQWGDIQDPWPFDPKEHALKKGKRNDPCRPEGQSTSNTSHNGGVISGVIRGWGWVRIRDIYLLLLQEPLWISVPPFIIQEIGKANTFFHYKWMGGLTSVTQLQSKGLLGLFKAPVSCRGFPLFVAHQ